MLPQSPLREPETWTTQDLANVETPTVESEVLITDEISQLINRDFTHWPKLAASRSNDACDQQRSGKPPTPAVE
jgi:hypothetical protein